jgi:hypothetical protein
MAHKQKTINSKSIREAIIDIAADNECSVAAPLSGYIRVPLSMEQNLMCDAEYINSQYSLTCATARITKPYGINEVSIDALLGNIPIVYSDKAYAIEYIPLD